MCNTISHRGPDGSGYWLDPSGRLALGHRRLSIIDTSETGSQPMVSACQRYVLSYNGEVYNFRQLRQELESLGDRFRGTSDTEVLLALFARRGVAQAIGAVNGMYAFAFWDRENETLWLGRDRLGEKPLYYGLVNGKLAFASELKAFSPLQGFAGGISHQALALYLRYSYIPAPFSIYENIKKLEPGCLLSISSNNPKITLQRYWDPLQVCSDGLRAPATLSEEAMTNEVERLLTDSIGLRMVSDVPLGAFLSGGIDSSLVVALMQAQSTRPIKTFTLGCPEWGFSETGDARAVAHHLKTEHTELLISSKEALDMIPQLPHMYDEPFGDSSQIPTHLVSKMARRSVTVCLSGDGGDEIFGGYNRYLWAEAIWKKISPLPIWFRKLISRLMFSLNPSTWSRLYTALEWAIPKGVRVANLGDKLHKVALALESETKELLYRNLASQCHHPSALMPGVREPLTSVTDPQNWLGVGGFTEWMMHQDMVTYLPDDILAKVDRASMAVSLECRVPFLDPRLIRLGWTLPRQLKFRAGNGKWILREILARYVPRELFERPKMGFGVPIDLWLRSPLRDWAEDLLSESRLRRDGVFDASKVRGTWQNFLANRDNSQGQIWTLLMFQAWFGSWRT